MIIWGAGESDKNIKYRGSPPVRHGPFDPTSVCVLSTANIKNIVWYCIKCPSQERARSNTPSVNSDTRNMFQPVSTSILTLVNYVDNLLTSNFIHNYVILGLFIV